MNLRMIAIFSTLLLLGCSDDSVAPLPDRATPQADGGTTVLKPCTAAVAEGNTCSDAALSCFITKTTSAAVDLLGCVCTQGKVVCTSISITDGASCNVLEGTSVPKTMPCPTAPACDYGCVCTSAKWKCTLTTPSHDGGAGKG